MDIKQTIENLANNWWHQTKDNAINYINIAIINGLVIAGAHIVAGYLQAKAIDNAVDRIMQPVEEIQLKVDVVINDVAEITKNAKAITGRVKAVDFKTVKPDSVKKVVNTIPRVKALPQMQDIRDYWNKSTPEKKN